MLAKKEEKKHKNGIEIYDNEMRKLNMGKHEFHGEWNYTIKPQL